MAGKKKKQVEVVEEDKNKGWKLFGIGVGTLVLGGTAAVLGFFWNGEKKKREELEKQVIAAGGVPVTERRAN